MTTQAPIKAPWQNKVETFASMFGPFTTTWDDFRSFREVEGYLEVYWPAMQSKVPPLVEIDSKPRCACCGSARPMFLRYLTDRNNLKHLVGHECYSRLVELKLVNHIDFNSPIPEPRQ
jgi:hypothetical protein